MIQSTSNTLMVGETISYAFTWHPTLYGMFHPPFNASNVIKRESFASFHVGGAQFAFCDGSVHFLSENIDNTSRQRNGATQNDLFDRANGGADFRTFQRLFARNDGYRVRRLGPIGHHSGRFGLVLRRQHVTAMAALCDHELLMRNCILPAAKHCSVWPNIGAA